MLGGNCDETTNSTINTPFPVSSQDFCEGDFNYNGSVGAEDVSTFLEHFGRSPFNNPCPPDGPSPVEKTWQWISYSPGDDGDYEHGVMWPNPRFTDNDDGTITDNLTGLMWLKDANCIASWYPGFDNDNITGDGQVIWQHALDFATGINDGSYSQCGGDPPYTDWRLPNIKELISLIHYGFSDPALPCTAGPCQWQEGDPFINVISDEYCSSTTAAGGTEAAWFMHTLNGFMSSASKVNELEDCYVWPVRGGR
jgi:hypothetical protein